MGRQLSALLVGICCFLTIAGESRSEHFILGTDPRDQQRDSYRIGLLRLALEHAPGDHTFDTADFDVNRGRAIRAFASGTAAFNVIDSGNSRERESRLTLVPVPLTRGFLGKRLLVIKQTSAHMFDGIDTLEGLRGRITFGSSPAWPDTRILRNAGLQVITGEKDQLYSMLARDRFIAYPRSMQEVALEIEFNNARVGAAPLMIEPTVMLSYRFDSFFYTGPGDTVRAQILEKGLRAAYETGAFEAYFYGHPTVQLGLSELERNKRRVIVLENPDLSDRIKGIPARYWHSFGGD